MSVNRYSVGYKDSASGRYAAMLDNPDGGYVSYEDHAALEQKLAESQREFRAADATIENMQMQVDKLAAENAGLKESRKNLAEFIHEELDAGYPLNMDVETPATDAFLAEVRASAIEHAASERWGSGYVFDELNEFAAQLRQEAAQ